MDINFFCKGLIIGFSIAAPVGPIGILCIRRTLSSGRLFGIFSGMGAATVDALYGSIAAFGLTFISRFLLHQQMWLRMLGGVFLCYLGVKTVLSQQSNIPSRETQNSLMSAYASTLLLTLTNPLTILSFSAIFAGFGLANGSYTTAAITVLGVFLGSSCWWFILTWITSLFRNRISVSALRWVNRISGSIIVAFGIAAFIVSIT